MQPDPTDAAPNQFATTVSNNGVIVPVEPSDLKSVWKMAEEIRDQSDPNERYAIVSGCLLKFALQGRT